METVFFKSSTRGHINHGWLDTYHTFSFADYYDPSRIHFGALRVVNDDTLVGGEGFGTHHHDNMEIITIPIYGALEHQDSMGNVGITRTGDVQVISAGTGILHSEFNADKNEPVNFFQIWVFPKVKNVEPRYQQMTIEDMNVKNKLVQIVSPNKEDDGLWIYQDAWFNIGTFEKEREVTYKIKKPRNGVFAMVIEGEFTIEGQKLGKRDSLSITGTSSFDFVAESEDARILLIDVPMYN